MNDENTTPRETPARCVELNLSGYPCGLRAVAGQDRCYIHGLFHALNDGRSTIDIPLLEDPQSILYVYSQVARALAQGAMPAANANGIIRCCNGAMKLLAEMRKHERFEERKKKAESRSQKPEETSQESESAEPAASPVAKDPQDQVDATVPPNLEVSEDASEPPIDSIVAAALPDARSDDRRHTAFRKLAGYRLLRRSGATRNAARTNNIAGTKRHAFSHPCSRRISAAL